MNLLFGWCWILIGLLVGAVMGLFFHREKWLGGYGTWRRRMVRLGHIAFLGTGFLNIFYALSLPSKSSFAHWEISSDAAMIGGAITMPLVCLLSAWRKPLRHGFAVPVVLLIGGVAMLIVQLVTEYR